MHELPETSTRIMEHPKTRPIRDLGVGADSKGPNE